MKVTIDGAEYPAIPIRDWSYEEATQVKRVCRVTIGEIQDGVMKGDSDATLAFAVVGFLRVHPDRDPAELRSRRIDDIVVDFTDDEADASPPAEGDAAAEQPAKEPPSQ